MEDKVIPFELLEEIFRYLNHEDLWRCLAVSKTWRNVSNANRLWKIQCKKLGIDEPSRSLESGGCNDLCLWASTYVTHYLMPLKNWRTGDGKVFEVSTYDSHFIDDWEGNKGVVYYYKADKLMVYEIDVDGVKCLEMSCFENFPREVFTISIGLSSNYIAISNYNIVIVFKKNSSAYEPFKAVAYQGEELQFVDYDEKFMKSVFSFDLSLQIKALSNGYLWLCDNFDGRLYIIDLVSGRINAHNALSYFRDIVNTPYVASWDEDRIKLYDKSGKVVFRSRISCWDVCFNKNIVVIGNKSSQTVETWGIKTNGRFISKSVLYHTDMVIHPYKNLVVLAEKSTHVCRFTCIDAVNGSIIWNMFPPENKRRCHDLKIISDCLFIWHSFLSRINYSLLNMCNGNLISEGLLPENKSYFSDTLWVYLDYNRFRIKSYLGFN
ncbi:uncharacterized protein [Halyomorpha halys]|nr:uncharacterized protein LOC106692442 isoform X2 [Halyomorpha halys]